MKCPVNICIIILLALSTGHSANKPPDVSKVRFEVTRVSKRGGVLHWKIVNNSDDEIYIYNFYLLGPAYNIEQTPGRVIFDTAPIVRVASCPPNRVAPVLLLGIRSGGMIEGDFSDPEIKKAGGKKVSLKISVGSEPDTVVAETKRFFDSDCAHSPYDAIVNWGTLLESTRIKVP